MTVHGLNVLHPDAEWPSFPVKHVRLWDNFVHWGAVHTGPGTFDFTRLDALVSLARSRGATSVCYVMSHTPTWASISPDGTTHAPWLNAGGNYPPFDMALWDEYVTAVVTRYRGRISSYQTWNEPQVKWFWQPRSMGPIAEMALRARRIIREHDPAAKVVAPPIAPQFVNGSGERLLSALKGKGWPVDVWTAHIYTKPDTHPPAWRRLAEAWRRMLASAGAPKRPRWVTETNACVGGGPLPAVEVEPYMDGIHRIAEDEGISRLYWYCWGTHGDPGLLGIPLVDGSPGAIVLSGLPK